MRLRRGTLLQSFPPIDPHLLQDKQHHLSVSYLIAICLYNADDNVSNNLK
jgi:hypothetical protein